MWCRSAVLLVALAACGDNETPGPAAQHRLSPAKPAAPAPGMHTITGVVIDRDTREGVSGVTVVLRGTRGELTTQSGTGGAWKLAVPRGTYRAFVRDPRVMSTGMQGRVRLRTLPREELAGAEDEELMPVLEVDGDATDVELGVTAGATLDGFVSDKTGEYISDVVITAVPLDKPIVSGGNPLMKVPVGRRTASRPVTGTDTVISDETGHFVLRVPAGTYSLLANHPRFGGFPIGTDFAVTSGERIDIEPMLERGCEITGRVIGADKQPVHDGALETVDFEGDNFLPSGRVFAGGTFRWTTPETGSITIRAWPWAQAASPPRTFQCADGRRFGNVVLTVPWEEPDMSGTLSDAHGNPVPFAYLDIAPLDDDDTGQQERTDASGNWRVFALRAGRYQITASAPGRGIVSEVIAVPRTDVALRLSGAGRLAGTTTELVDGSFEVTFHECGSSADTIELEDEPRIVVVRGGRFVIDRVPACTVTFSVRWRDRMLTQSVVVEPDRTAFIELPLGAPREKQVHGVVRDDAGKTVANARITALVDNQEATTVRSDADGRYSLTTQAGAQLVAGNGRRVGSGTVGRANVATEQVDIALVSAAGDQ